MENTHEAEKKHYTYLKKYTDKVHIHIYTGYLGIQQILFNGFIKAVSCTLTFSDVITFLVLSLPKMPNLVFQSVSVRGT